MRRSLRSARPLRFTAAAIGVAILGLVASNPGEVRAADLGAAGPTIVEGVPCESPEVQTFPSVWLGHFSGGYSHYLGPGQPIVLDWRDEKLCFPARRSCDRYMAEMRRDFHRPEGYFTCLPIR